MEAQTEIDEGASDEILWKFLKEALVVYGKISEVEIELYEASEEMWKLAVARRKAEATRMKEKERELRALLSFVELASSLRKFVVRHGVLVE